jgi:3-dehydroquinate synthetase
MKMDKKVAAGRLRFVLFDGLGRSEVVDDVPAASLRRVLGAADAGQSAGGGPGDDQPHGG